MRFLTVSLSVAIGFALAVLVQEPRQVAVGGQGANCTARNGDVNADGAVDLSDAITILGNLFQGSPTALAPLCAPPPAGRALAATGQTVCYEFVDALWVAFDCLAVSCPGQDGWYAGGCPTEGRFVDNGDGTVTDSCTGLMWQKDTVDNDPEFPDTFVWCQAMSYCEQLTLAGHDDWRLPNVRELQSIVDYGRISPAIDPLFGALPQYYWSSTTHMETSNDAWGVGFNVGYVGVRPKEGDLEFSYNFVRAVRSAP